MFFYRFKRIEWRIGFSQIFKRINLKLDKLVEKGYYKDRSEVIRDMVRHGVLGKEETEIEELKGVREAKELERKVKRVEEKLDSLVESFREHSKRSLPEWAKEK